MQVEHIPKGGVEYFPKDIKKIIGSKNVTTNIYWIQAFCTGFIDFMFKGSVHHIFASLFCKFKGEYLWNKEKCFLFHFESSFNSWDN